MPNFFNDIRLRTITLWVTDMLVLLASYFYVTNPDYVKQHLAKMDITRINPDLDPSMIQSPELFEMIYPMLVTGMLMTIAVVVVIHTFAFYQSYRRKKPAVAYVKIYSALAAAALFIWLLYNLNGKGVLVLIPMASYACVFMAEKKSNDIPAR